MTQFLHEESHWHYEIQARQLPLGTRGQFLTTTYDEENMIINGTRYAFPGWLKVPYLRSYCASSMGIAKFARKLENVGECWGV